MVLKRLYFAFGMNFIKIYDVCECHGAMSMCRPLSKDCSSLKQVFY